MATVPAEGGTKPFAVKNCALLSITTGLRAHNLSEFRNGFLSIPATSIYHPFWGRLLRPQFDEPEYSNDFASWAHHSLNERPLAERLSAIDPTEYESLEEVRQELVELLEQAIGEHEYLPWAPADKLFYFLHSRPVVFDTDIEIGHPSKLQTVMPTLALGSVYYNFIDSRRRTPNREDDFSAWLAGWGTEYEGLIRRLSAIDPYFSSLAETRRVLAVASTAFFRDHV